MHSIRNKPPVIANGSPLRMGVPLGTVILDEMISSLAMSAAAKPVPLPVSRHDSCDLAFGSESTVAGVTLYETYAERSRGTVPEKPVAGSRR
jgi:hypothetical protein